MKWLALALVLAACSAPAVAISEPTATSTPTATASPTPTPTPVPTVDCSGPVPVYPCNYKSPVPAAPITCTAAFCYPRLGINGPIIDDPSKGAVDPFLTIVRDTTYLRGIAISAHGYTSFGNIAEWRAGDLVVVDGRQYTVFDGFTVICGEHINLSADQATAKVFLQTSLNSEPCESGKHIDLFVVAR